MRKWIKNTLLFTVSLLSVNCNALTLAKISDEVLIRNANSIVYGTIENINTEKIQGNIFTRYTVRIKNQGLIKKGSLEDDSVVDFYMIGGRIGSEWLDVPGLVKLQKGREYVLFFEKRDLGLTIFGSNQGTFSVVTDPLNGEKAVVKLYDPEVYGAEVGNRQSGLKDFIKWVKETGGYN